MSKHFGDRLSVAIQAKGTPTCVGIDPVYDRLPASITSQDGFDDATDIECVIDAVMEYCRCIIKIVAPLVPAVKINIAFFEQYHWDGLEAYHELVQEARSRGLIVIGDVKRADIGHTSAMYARAHLAAPDLGELDDLMIPDAVTVNPYFGLDGVKPFIDAADKNDKGVFVLVQTSNETAAEVQGLELAAGGTVVEHVGRLVQSWAGEPSLLGVSGFSLVGAVASPQSPDAMARLRAAMPNCFFLVPGFGAQGRSADDIKPCFKADGTGALITASRSVIYAYEETKYLEMYASEWDKCVEHACKDFVKSIAAVVGV